MSRSGVGLELTIRSQVGIRGRESEPGLGSGVSFWRNNNPWSGSEVEPRVEVGSDPEVLIKIQVPSQGQKLSLRSG
ncbi:hypothetical protein KY290_031786 [Solanum tuberosum]|uniref:Uncharacterized protein n=1 Tax=Solanum tuberosum TaxID=4113 RepID=A0ABQ7UC09_SOLTU|nr:hypothetical protein KY289_031182 [Solanum tuberosum]KAH0743793.1 hypothetical protein KY290_031786 [Solanum tuberosum]